MVGRGRDGEGGRSSVMLLSVPTSVNISEINIGILKL